MSGTQSEFEFSSRTLHLVHRSSIRNMLDVHQRGLLRSRNRRRILACAAILCILSSFRLMSQQPQGSQGSSQAIKGKSSKPRKPRSTKPKPPKPDKPKSDKPNAVWSDAEQATIVNFLHAKRSEGGDGGTFKRPTLNALVLHIQTTHPDLTAKDLSQVEGKWRTVSHHDSHNQFD